MHFKEHTGPTGRLHLNVLWDWPWLNQRELSTLSAACGFGPICHISRVGLPIELAQGRPASSAAVRYSTKTGFRVVAYARKTGGRTALVGRRAGVASGIAALTMLALSADRKFEPRLYHYDEWLARQRRAWAPRGPDGQFRIATE
jgi:hypothetical protein